VRAWGSRRSSSGWTEIRRAAALLGLVLAGAGLALHGLGRGWLGAHRGAGAIEGAAVPRAAVAARGAERADAARKLGAAGARQILFGDLHVHTTFSTDAFLMSLPVLGGEGAHPPADACDYARHCAGLDFWSINDHAEGLTPAQWSETVESVRQCNALAGDPADPDLVTFLGWEWSQVGSTPENHYGHKNVVLLGTGADEIPARPIAARAGPGALISREGLGPPWAQRVAAVLTAPGGRRQDYHDLMRYFAESEAVPACPDGVPVRELPADCHESAATPEELFAKLDEWGLPALVIPHGNSWGFYTPPGSSLAAQLPGHDPERQRLVEVFSGHGSSEEYRAWREVERDAQGRASCPAPRPDYLPSCWRAGELVRARCAAGGGAAAECEERALVARQRHVEAGVAGFLTVPGASAADWLDAGQCRDCFLPAFNYRPGGSAQHTLALTWFGAGGARKRFRLGFIASSDNHAARPGNGFKERDRQGLTEAAGPPAPDLPNPALGPPREAGAASLAPAEATRGLRAFQLVEAERQMSFFMTGGLVAVHAAGRDRRAVFDALRRREVYGTSGDRILLWFELLNPPGGGPPAPMGSELRMSEAPSFAVRAAGAPEQLPGCAEPAPGGLSAERLERLCLGECYHPGDERRRIARIEIVRIRPQRVPGEPVATLVEDPWRSFECPPDPAGCRFEVSDEGFAAARRDAVYYARALQEPSPAVNAGGLRCRRDAAGRCESVDPCYGDWRTDASDDCLAPVAERAWSSPIFVDFTSPGDATS
jgi:hypothetical protein